jgi:hypothetical protein
MLPSLVQLPIGTGVEVGLRDGSIASLEAIGRLECSICYEPLGPAVEWLVPCVHHHAFHRECLANWVRQAAPRVGADRVPCPYCGVVLTYPNGNGEQYRQIAMQAIALRALPQRMQRQQQQQHEAAQVEPVHPRAARLGPQDAERDRAFAKDLSLLDWWSATFDESEVSPSVADPAPGQLRRIDLYPGLLGRTLELAAYGFAEKQRRDTVARRSRALYEAAWALVRASVYGPRGMELLELHDAEWRLYGGAYSYPPSRELRQWIDEYRLRERAILEGDMAEGAVEAAHREWAEALRYLERG